MGVMRSSLIGGLVGTLAFNLKRRAGRVRVFEIGRCFMHDSSDTALVDGYQQPLRLGGLCAGPALPEQWGSPTRNVDFFDVKADLEALLAPLRLSFAKTEHPALHPGRAATISCDGASIGVIGELHPRWAQKYELGVSPVVFEVDIASLLARSVPRYRMVSRFPVVVRDIALVVEQRLPVQLLTEALTAAAPAIVREIQLFDLYQGKGLEPNQKSLAYRILMQDTEKTLEDSEVEAAVARLVNAASRIFGAALRA
jgi:phenylalanyl-tRNA synthetase beta chain